MPRPNRPVQRAAALALLVALCSCHGKPTGQVVAKVDGQEVTAAELNLEMAQTPPNPANPGAVQQVALQRIVARKLLAKEAAKRKLDATPSGQSTLERARATTLVQLLQAKLEDTPLDTSDSAVRQYIDAHPAQFADRRLIEADQLAVDSASPDLAAQLKGMTDFSAIEAFLTGKNIAFVRTGTVLDTSEMPSDEVARLVALQPNSVMVGPAPGGGLRVTRIASSRSVPLLGDSARDTAVKLMRFDHSQAARAAIQKILDNGKSRVWIDPAFAKS